MKRIAFALCAASFALFACNAASAQSIKTPDEAWVPVDSATAMKAWMEFATPSDMHKMMASWNGEWTGEMTMWMGNGAPPTKSTTTAVNSMILGDRYQMSKHTGSFEGMPFEGVSITAYDNAKKMFISTWMDNMGTGIMKLSGTWDAATKTLTSTGTQTDPSRNGKDCTVREVFKIIDDNNHLMEMYGPDPMTGKEFKTMEVKYTRKK